MRRYPSRVENYTNAFLSISGLILFMAFWTLAATMGIVWVMIIAAMMDGLIQLRSARLGATRTG